MTGLILCSISKTAVQLIKAGKAVLSSGGVRSLTGQLIEMAKPIASSVNALSLGPVAAGVNLASSLANNVQSGVLQHSINIANAKLDVVVQQLSSLSTAMQGLAQVQALSWVTSAFSLANCGISVAGFQMTLSKLDKLHSQLSEFFDRYQQDRNSDRAQEFHCLFDNLKTHVGFLAQRNENDTFDQQSFLQREATVEEHLNASYAYLHAVIDDFRHQRIDGQLGCRIIFTLSTAYAQTVNEYCCQYFYLHGVPHHMYGHWISILDEIDSPAFRDYLKQYFIRDVEYITVSPRVKQAAHHLLFESISQQKAKLALCAETIQHIPETEYIRLDDTLNQEVLSGLFLTLPELRGKEVDQILIQRIESNEYQVRNDDTIWIPLTA